MGLKIHFLNVGIGDCSILHFPTRIRTSDNVEIPERIMMVDVNNSEDNTDYEDIIAYYKANFKNANGTIKSIFRFVCTHPHLDHIKGLSKLFNDSQINIFNFWDTDHKWEPLEFNDETHEEDWAKYKELRESETNPKALKYTREDPQSQYWNDEEDRIEILCPSKKLIEWAHENEDGTERDVHDIEIDEMSYALLIKFNGRKIILAGDGRATPVWDDIYENCKAKIQNCEILKAGHHGQETSFHEDAIKHINPDLVIFSNSEACDDKDGAEKLYKDALPNAIILKTCEYGTMIAEIPFDRNKPIIVKDSSGNIIC